MWHKCCGEACSAILFTASSILAYCVVQNGERICVSPAGVVYEMTGFLTNPTAHETGEVVDWMVPKSIEKPDTR